MSDLAQRASAWGRWLSKGFGRWALNLVIRLGVLIGMAALSTVVALVTASIVVVTPVTPFDIVSNSSTAYTVDCNKIGAVINAVRAGSSSDSAMKKWGFDSKDDRRFQAIDAALQQRLTICHK